MLRQLEKNFSSFRKSDSLPCSKTDLSVMEPPNKTAAKCLSSENYKSKSINNVAKVKRGKSTTNIETADSREHILNIREQYSGFDCNPNSSKFTKQYLKMKLAKIFRSNSKINNSIKSKPGKPKTDIECDSCNHSKSHSTLMKDNNDASNDALRNLSFTAAMMTKSSSLLNRSLDVTDESDHTTPIPSSTLRFWRKPSEEKLKASQRRIQETIHGSNEILLRNNPTFDNKKHPSELSLFYDDGNSPCEAMRISNSDIRSSVTVQGFDKALNRYQNIVSQSRHVSRKKKTLSLAYETDTNVGNNKMSMRTSQSSNNMSNLTRSNSVAHGLSPETKKSLARDDYRAPFLRGKSLSRDMSSSLSPPSYDTSVLNKKPVKSRIYSSRPTNSRYDPEISNRSRITSNTVIHRPPKPPPRSDSLIRSFELICKNLTTSISEPRGDSFKIFKSQRDYENWLKSLPYNDPHEIAALLKMRSKIARRQCVSELIDFHEEVYVDNERQRRLSWPLQNSASISFETVSDRRTSSLSRVKKKKDTDNVTKSFDSPSLCNYSRLYSLRNSDPRTMFGSSHRDSSHISIRSPLSSAIRNRRPFRYRYKYMTSLNPRMTESCHESERSSII